MAVLKCDLCGRESDRPLQAGGHTFCCHGCRELWGVLGDEGMAALRSGPEVINWEAVWEAGEADPGQQAAGHEVRTASLALSGLWCASCAQLIHHVVSRRPGVLGVRVDFAAARAEVAYDATVTGVAQLDDAIARLGYGAREGADMAPRGSDPVLLWRLGVAVFLTAVIMMFSVPIWSGYLPDLGPPARTALAVSLWALATPVVFWAGWPFLRGAAVSIRHALPTMDVLVAVGSVAAYAYSCVAVVTGGRYLYFDTAGMIVSFLLLGRNLELGARERVTRVLSLLAGMAEKSAWVVRDGVETQVAVAAVAVGDEVVVRPGQRVPVDGVVFEGESAVDESLLTGEPVAVTKAARDIVYAGTLNTYGRMVVRVTRASDDTVLGRTVLAMREAQARKGAWQRLADSVLRVFVPLVLGISALTFAVGYRFGHLGVGPSLLRAIATLVIACPCALAVTTPLAVLAGSQRLGRRGVLLRRGDAVERAATVDTVLIDKTGTLTRGRMHVSDVFPDDPALLSQAAAVESGSEHPIAAAVVEAAGRRGLAIPAVEEFRALPGLGAQGRVGGRRVRVGAAAEALPPHLDRLRARWEAAGRTVLAVSRDDEVAGIMSVEDGVRPEAADAVARLAAMGVAVEMITGDAPGPAQAVAEAVGIAHWRARCRPDEKAGRVRALQEAGRRVAFVGDGVNDALALVQADLGLALATGADIAVEAGQLTLVHPDLRTLPEVLEASRETVATIRVNLWWALVYNVLALPAAALGFASPALAALAMVCSSALVLGNTLRLMGGVPWRMIRGVLAVVAFAAVLGVVAWQGV